MLNYINLNKENNSEKADDLNFIDEKILIDNSNYYFSNVIARASKTMADCNMAKLKLKKTGTEG